MQEPQNSFSVFLKIFQEQVPMHSPCDPDHAMSRLLHNIDKFAAQKLRPCLDTLPTSMSFAAQFDRWILHQNKTAFPHISQYVLGLKHEVDT